MRAAARVATILVAVILGASAPAWAVDDPNDTEAPSDEAVGKCVTKCESEHEKCTAAAKARTDDCERQKSACEAGCSLCRRMYGPEVVTCVNDCAACRNRIAASPCGKDKDAGDDTECARALDACLERCGP